MAGDPVIHGPDGARSPGATGGARDLSWSLEKREVSYIRIDHQTRLQFESVEIVIEGGFALRRAGREWRLAADRRAELGPLLAVYPATLARGWAEPDATLRLDFEDGSSITVPAHPQWEAWQVVGPGTALVVCLPGASGLLSVWS
jgi:hypothetical protein